MRIFAKASIDLRESERLLSSMSNAENAVELYKHFSGDLEAVASALGGTAAGNALKIHYDKDWNVCPPALCEYTLTLAKIEYSQTGKADITVSGRDGKTIVSFAVTVLWRWPDDDALGINIGTVSIVLILTLLCLTIFRCSR